MGMHTDSHGKSSSKRIWGTIILGSAVSMTWLGGLHWYDPNPEMVKTMFWSGCTLLGLGVTEKLFALFGKKK